MSTTAPNKSTTSQRDRHSKRAKRDVHEAITQIDNRLIDLSERILPPHPYLLSVPTDIPYRFDRRFVNTWFTGTPFGPHEEQLQYMSFRPHQDPDEDLLKVVGGWSDANGNVLQDEQEESQLPTGPMSGYNTPTPQTARKKISLKDYKTKDKTRNNEMALKPPQDERAHNIKSESRENGVNAEEKSKGLQANSNRVIKHEKTDHQPLTSKDLPPKPPTISRRPDSPSPPKRRRLSSEEPVTDDDRGRINRKIGGKEKKKALPRLLSPTLPASDKDKHDRGLPRLLSPDLPVSLLKHLDNSHGQNHGQGVKRSEPVRTILSNALASPTAKRPSDRSGDNGRNRSDSQLSLKTVVNAGKASPHLKPSIKADTRPATPVQARSPGPRQRHTVVLKYGKKNRRRVEALLKLAPRPKKVRPIIPPEDVPRRVPDVAIKSLPTIPKPEPKKRPADLSPERPAKKAKPIPGTPDRPQTPLAAIRSPVVKSKKDLQATPKKELKPSAMQRIASSEGQDVKTPPIDRGRTSTPLSSMQTKESPVAGSASAERARWVELKRRYFELGRTLKREGQELAKNTRSESDQALAVINLIEALLCFMVHLSADSHLRPSIDPGWHTIAPYHSFVSRFSKRYDHLHALVLQVGAVWRQIWHNYNIDRLHRDPLPDEQCNSAPTPGSDGNTKTDDGEKYKKHYLDFRDQLVSNSRELQAFWLEGSRTLSPNVLSKEYPKTWAGRTDSSMRTSPKINPNQISDAYYLPLDPCANPFEATRFALRMMAEWCEKEQLQWKTRIHL